MNTEVLCVIPARKGSTRVKGKNTKLLGGYPLIEWTIKDALLSENIDRIVVTTDDPDVKKIALKYGVDVVNRPKELANNILHVDKPIKHVIDYLYDEENYEPDLVVLLQPTSPFRDIAYLDAGIKKCLKYDSLVYVIKNDKFYWNPVTHKPINYNYECRPRSQDKLWELIETGNYVSKTYVYDNVNRLGGNIGFQLVSKKWDIDIDTEEDFEFAEHYQDVYKIRIEEK